MNFIELPVYLSYRLPLNLKSSVQVFLARISTMEYMARLPVILSSGVKK